MCGWKRGECVRVAEARISEGNRRRNLAGQSCWHAVIHVKPRALPTVHQSLKLEMSSIYVPTPWQRDAMPISTPLNCFVLGLELEHLFK